MTSGRDAGLRTFIRCELAAAALAHIDGFSRRLCCSDAAILSTTHFGRGPDRLEPANRFPQTREQVFFVLAGETMNLFPQTTQTLNKQALQYRAPDPLLMKLVPHFVQMHW